MDISEFDLLRKFIEEKNLLNQYQEWRKFYVKDYENVVVKFCCLNGKYEFEITIARKQLPYSLNGLGKLNQIILFCLVLK